MHDHKSPSRSSKIGQPPGSLIFIGENRETTVAIELFKYDKESYTESDVINVSDCMSQVEKGMVCWFNVDGIHDADKIKAIGEEFQLHELLLEDIMNSSHRPKLEEYENCVFVTFKMLFIDAARRIQSEQVSVVLGDSWLISFQEQPGDVLDSIRERIRAAKGRVRFKDVDYLLYLILDTVVDNYFTITEHIEHLVEKIEHRITEHPDQEVVTEIQQMKRELNSLKKFVQPVKEEIAILSETDVAFVQESTRMYFKDVLDHTGHVLESLDSSRDVLNSLLEMYHSTLSTQMNQVMKVLTIVSALFIPLTFIAGVYGMNFNHEASDLNMPELYWKYGYLFAWGLMIALFIAMLIYFKRKKWI